MYFVERAAPAAETDCFCTSEGSGTFFLKQLFLDCSFYTQQCFGVFFQKAGCLCMCFQQTLVGLLLRDKKQSADMFSNADADGALCLSAAARQIELFLVLNNINYIEQKRHAFGVVSFGTAGRHAGI